MKVVIDYKGRICLVAAIIGLISLCAILTADAAPAKQNAEANGALIALWPKDDQIYYSNSVPNVSVAQVKALIRSGADISASDEQGNTPLMRASEAGNLLCVQFLVSSGAKTEARNHEGWTALVFACFLSKVDCARYLISRGAIVDTRDKGGETILRIVAQGLAEESFAADANAGHPVAKVDGQDGLMRCVRLLVSQGADVNAADNDGGTSLMWVAQGDGNVNLECVKFLVSKGAKVDVQDKDGTTALMNIASGMPIYSDGKAWNSGRIDCAKYLLSKGANLSLRNKDGKTALMLATNPDMISIFTRCRVDARPDSARSSRIGYCVDT